MFVREARDQYLLENGHSTRDYFRRYLVVKFLSLRIYLPCSPTLHWHDLHHIACGYGGGLRNEALVSVFELHTQDRPLIVNVYCWFSILCAFPFTSRKIFALWKKVRRSRGFYGNWASYEKLLDLKVSDLRQLLNIPEEGFSV
jgi:hypothetical protein